MKITFFLIIFCLFLFIAGGCSLKTNQTNIEELTRGSKISKHAKIAHNIMSDATRTIEKQYNASLVKFGTSIHSTVESLDLGFSIPKKLSQDELRKMLVNSVGIFLKAINSNEEIQPYLHEIPFTEKNVKIVFYPPDENSSPSYISGASARNGNVIF